MLNSRRILNHKSEILDLILLNLKRTGKLMLLTAFNQNQFSSLKKHKKGLRRLKHNTHRRLYMNPTWSYRLRSLSSQQFEAKIKRKEMEGREQVNQCCPMRITCCCCKTSNRTTPSPEKNFMVPMAKCLKR